MSKTICPGSHFQSSCHVAVLVVEVLVIEILVVEVLLFSGCDSKLLVEVNIAYVFVVEDLLDEVHV